MLSPGTLSNRTLPYRLSSTYSRSGFSIKYFRYYLVFITFLTANNLLYAQAGKIGRLMRHENFDKAVNFATDKITEYENNPRKVSKLEAFHFAFGKIYYKLGEHNDAEKEYNIALDLVLRKKASGKRLQLPDYDVMDDLALFYVNKGNFREARSLIDSSLKWRYRKITKNDPAVGIVILL